VLITAFALALLVRPAQAEVPSGTPVFSNPLAITNPFQPFRPGALKVFSGSDHGTKTESHDIYLRQTREFQWNGKTVKCRILREVAFEDGELVESSDNYFAQADDGTVYYFGEVVDNYVDGVIANHDGSWLVGGPTLASDPPEIATYP